MTQPQSLCTCKNGHNLTHSGALYQHPDGRKPLCRLCENTRRRKYWANATPEQRAAKQAYQIAHRAKQNQPDVWRLLLP